MSPEININNNRLLILCVALLFGVFGVEAFLGHSFLLGTEYWQALIPLVFSILGIIISLLTFLKPSRIMVLCFKVTMVLAIMTAVGGFYYHGGVNWDSSFWLTPIIAPASYFLPAILGLVATRKISGGTDQSFGKGNGKFQKSSNTGTGLNGE